MNSIIILTGPTGVGKTSLSLELAQARKGEIISIDSRQIYKELDIGTAKPAPEELKQVPHHFISERSIHEAVSAGAFAKMAEERIASLLKLGKTPIVVGGSPLYIQALQYGLANIPKVPEEIRSTLDERLRSEGGEALYAELIEVDPTAAETMDPTKTQRIVRALEVYHGTGQPLSHYHQNHPKPAFSYRTYVLFRDRQHLYARINKRVDLMLAAGLVEEVTELLNQGVDPTLPVLRTIGYQEVILHLKGEYDYAEMVRLIKRNSRRYAKRQLTWFRRFEEYKWIDLDSADDPLSSIQIS